MEADYLLEEKKALRRKMKKLRSAVTDRKIWDQKRCSRLLQLPQVRAAHRIYVYASYGTEAGTWEFIQTCLDKGKQIALPRVCGQEMDFYRIACLEDLCPGAYGIQEPGIHCQKVIPEEMDCMILPGLAFDGRGHRLGYGGGYYDRYLERYPFQKENRIALAYDCQVTDYVPSEPTDICVGLLVTESRAMVTESF